MKKKDKKKKNKVLINNFDISVEEQLEVLNQPITDYNDSKDDKHDNNEQLDSYDAFFNTVGEILANEMNHEQSDAHDEVDADEFNEGTDWEYDSESLANGDESETNSDTDGNDYREEDSESLTNGDESLYDQSENESSLLEAMVIHNEELNFLAVTSANMDSTTIRTSGLKAFDNEINTNSELIQNISDEFIDKLLLSVSPCAVFDEQVFMDNVLSVINEVDDEQFSFYRKEVDGKNYVLCYYLSTDSFDTICEFIESATEEKIIFPLFKMLKDYTSGPMAFNMNSDKEILSLNDDADKQSAFMNMIYEHPDTLYISNNGAKVSHIQIKNIEYKYDVLIDKVANNFNKDEKESDDDSESV